MILGGGQNSLENVVLKCLNFCMHSRDKPSMLIAVSSAIMVNCEIYFLFIWMYNVARISSVGKAIRYRLDGLGSIPGEGEIFRTRPDRPWGPPSLLYNGHWVFPGGNLARPWRWLPSPPPSSAEVKERVELYLCSPFWTSWPDLEWTLPFTFTYIWKYNTNCKHWLLEMEVSRVAFGPKDVIFIYG